MPESGLADGWVQADMGGDNGRGGGKRARSARRGVEKNFLFEIRSPAIVTNSASGARADVPIAVTDAPSGPHRRVHRGDAQLDSTCIGTAPWSRAIHSSMRLAASAWQVAYPKGSQAHAAPPVRAGQAGV